MTNTSDILQYIGARLLSAEAELADICVASRSLELIEDFFESYRFYAEEYTEIRRKESNESHTFRHFL